MNKKSILEMSIAEAMAEGYSLDEIQEAWKEQEEKRKEEDKMREAVKTARQAAKSALLDYAIVLGVIENNEEKADLEKTLEAYMVDMEKDFEVFKSLKEMNNKVKLYNITPKFEKKVIPSKEASLDKLLTDWLKTL